MRFIIYVYFEFLRWIYAFLSTNTTDMLYNKNKLQKL